MKGTILVDGRLYLIKGEREGTSVQLFSGRGKLIARFPTWKKQEWLDEAIDDQTRSKLNSVIDGLRRVARFSKIGVILG